MEIKEGMYVRTKNGIIAKCTEVKVNKNIFDRIIFENGYYVDWEFIDIPKEQSVIEIANFDIIELINPGDYVNGKEVIISGYNIYDDWCVTVKSDDGCNDYIYPKEIKSIVTKEQFESMSYKLED